MTADVTTTGTEGAPQGPWPGAFGVVRKRKWMESVIGFALFGCALISVMTTVGIVVVLAVEAFQFFREVSIFEFLTGTEWAPKLAHKFGILPLLSGTLLVTAGAGVIAMPIGLLSAVYLSEYASNSRARGCETGARSAGRHSVGSVWLCGRGYDFTLDSHLVSLRRCVQRG